MLIRTHFVIAFFGILLMIDHVSNVWIFCLGVLVATFIPDLDSHNSKLGRKGLSRVLTAFTKHRGIMHSLIFALFLYFLLRYVWFSVSFGFLFGYCVHLFCDCLTRRGVRLFYPFKFRLKGFIRSGGRVESFLFLAFGFLDLIMLSIYILN